MDQISKKSPFDKIYLPVFLQALSSTEPLLVFEGGHEVHIGGRCFFVTFQNTKDFHREISEFVLGCKKLSVFHHGNLRGPPECHVYPQEIAGPNKA